MAKKRRIVRRPRVIEEELENVVEEVADEGDEEEVVVAPRGRRGRRGRPARVVEEVDEDGEILEDGEEEELPAPKRSRRRLPVIEEEDEEVEVKEVAPKVKLEKVDAVMASSIVMALLMGLNYGQTVIFQRDDGGFSIETLNDIAVALDSKKLKGRAYWDEVTDPKYREWDEEWREKSYEEKVQFAKKLKLTWNQHENPKVDVIRLTQAVRDHLGISKYKAKYRSRSAREAIKA